MLLSMGAAILKIQSQEYPRIEQAKKSEINFRRYSVGNFLLQNFKKKKNVWLQTECSIGVSSGIVNDHPG